MKETTANSTRYGQEQLHGKARIVLATVVALVVASLMLVLFILPAEYNRDPTGIGEALGIKGLSGAGPSVLTLNGQNTSLYQEEVSFELLPFEFVEYKYRLSEGAALVYVWDVEHEVSFEFHGEPDDGPAGYAETFSIGKGVGNKAAFTAPFSGIHGWYWANRGAEPVTVTLKTAGFYTATHAFRDGYVDEVVLEEVVEPDEKPE
ncbi:MAG TPA: hypothetical protein DCF62_13125 [Porticoccaceae bacterium]|nr:hypothetical protein [Porticoccaceae bacterium]HCO60438.1 hypothetical protein [Porticoccaceae bacterium]